MRFRRALLLVLAWWAIPAFGWEPVWLPQSPLKTSLFRKMFTADFNEDGTADIVSRTSNLSILLSLTQDGDLTTPVEIHRGDYLSDLATGDIDGDGRTDVISTDIATNMVVALRSNGDGTFAPPVTTLLPFAPTYIEAGDFDEDGDLDLVVTSYSAAILAHLRGDGTGAFVESSRVSRTGLASDTVAGDVDQDGHEDIVVVDQTPDEFHVYFGVGNGTFTAPTILPVLEPSTAVSLADLDGDGDLEIVSCEFWPNTLTVVLNAGSRAFSAATSYELVAPHPNPYGSAYDLVIDDFTNDGIPDVVVALANERQLATLEGRGNGTFDDPVYTNVPQTTYNRTTFPGYVVSGDFAGDAQPDLLVAMLSDTKLTVFENASGQSTVTLSRNHPTILVGQTVELKASVYSRDGWNRPTGGEVTFFDGPAEIARVALVDGYAKAMVDSLPAGVRSITASFESPGNWRTTVSTALEVNVVTTPTTVTLTSSLGGNTITYGSSFGLRAVATSELAGPLNGTFRLYFEGSASSYGSQLDPSWTAFPGNVGTYSYYVEYEGDATHPPAKSNVLTIEVTKARTRIETNFPPVVVAGSNAQFEARLSSPDTSGPSEPVMQLYEGTTPLSTLTGSGSWRAWPALPVGVHYVRVVFEGTGNYEASASPWVRVTVVPSDSFVLDVFARDNKIYAWAWFNGSISYTSSYYFKVLRRIGDGPWGYVSSSFNAAFEQSNPQPGTVYAFRVEARAWNTDELIAQSNVDLALVTSFTDNPILPGTPMKAQHVTELVSATNAVRAGAGLPAWPLAVQTGQVIRAYDIESLRVALNEGLARFGVLPVEYAAGVVPGAPIRVEHVQSMRERLH